MLLTSNLVQIGLTAAAGMLLRNGVSPRSPLMAAVTTVLASIVVAAAILRVGEFYAYSDVYVRSFAFLGDQITTVLVFLFFIAVATDRTRVAALAAVAILLSGGKISFLIAGAVALALVAVRSGGRRRLAMRFIALGVVGLLGYGLVVTASHVVPGLVAGALETRVAALVLGGAESDTSHALREALQPTISGQGACETAESCLQTQVGNALKQRWMSLAAGAWMTLQGGYPGDAYPGSAEALAEMMLSADPWGINRALDLTRADWLSVGHIQHPYAAFGAGYGPWLLAGLLISLGAGALLALKVLRTGIEPAGQVCAVFFIAIVLLNQTQPWLTPNSYVLVVLGYCAADIALRSAARAQLGQSTRAASPAAGDARSSESAASAQAGTGS